MNAIHKLTHLIHSDPQAARAIIAKTLRENGMNKTRTALALGCGHATMLRWISQLGMNAEIDRMNGRSVKEGWHHGSPCSKCGVVGHNARTCGREKAPRKARTAKPKARAAAAPKAAPKARSKAPRASKAAAR